MLKKLLKTWISKSELKKFVKINEIQDIIIYGSLIRGKHNFNDIDVAIIINKKTNLNKKLKISQKFRNKFPFENKKIDVKTISKLDLMDPGFIARQAIIAEGYSLLNNEFIHNKFGFVTFVIFDYDLTSLTTSQKKMLYYALNGRRSKKGLLYEKESNDLGNTLVKVPLKHSEEFNDFFKYNNCKFKSWISVEYKL